jgi:hypothetical protein
MPVMTEPQTITTDHVRALLDAAPGSTIGLIEGRVEVIGADSQGSDDYRGALEVITRDDLVDRLGEDPDDSELAEQADHLSQLARTLGG